jgi:AbrB family looped-hinge helix DNA binding protein
MRELETTITQKGQVTIPIAIRTRLGLKPRDRVRFEVEGDEVKLRPVPSRILRGYGSIAPRTTDAILNEQDVFEQAVAEEVVQELASER